MKEYEENLIKYDGDKNKAFIITLIENSSKSLLNVIKKNNFCMDDIVLSVNIESNYYNIHHTETIGGCICK
jgi:hypothetical protein